MTQKCLCFSEETNRVYSCENPKLLSHVQPFFTILEVRTSHQFLTSGPALI